MYFTDREKGAILHLTGIMAAADGVFAEEEKAMIVAIAATIGENGNGAKLAQSMNDSEALAIVNAMTADEKRFVCSALGALIAIDKNVDKREMLVWNLISHRCSFPEMNVLDAIDIFKSYL